MKCVLRHSLAPLLGVLMIGLAGCGNSDAELDEAYGLNDPAYKSNAAKPIVGLAKDLQRTLRGRETPPKLAVSMVAENLGGFSKESFGEFGKDFEEIKSTVNEMSSEAESGAPTATIRELAKEFLDQAEALEKKIDSGSADA